MDIAIGYSPASNPGFSIPLKNQMQKPLTQWLRPCSLWRFALSGCSLSSKLQSLWPMFSFLSSPFFRVSAHAILYIWNIFLLSPSLSLQILALI